MLFEDALDDGQPQPRAHAGGVRLVRLVEAVEDKGQVVLGDAGAVILHISVNALAGAAHAHAQRAALGQKLQGVVDEVADHLTDAPGVGHDPAGRFRQFRRHFYALFLDAPLEAQQRAAHLLAQVYARHLHGELAALDAGKV